MVASFQHRTSIFFSFFTHLNTANDEMMTINTMHNVVFFFFLSLHHFLSFFFFFFFHSFFSGHRGRIDALDALPLARKVGLPQEHDAIVAGRRQHRARDVPRHAQHVALTNNNKRKKEGRKKERRRG